MEPEFVHHKWQSEIWVFSTGLIKLPIPQERSQRLIQPDVEEDWNGDGQGKQDCKYQWMRKEDHVLDVFVLVEVIQNQWMPQWWTKMTKVQSRSPSRYREKLASFRISPFLNLTQQGNSPTRLGLEVDKSQSHRYLKNQIYSNIQISFNIYFIFLGFWGFYSN